MSIDWTINIGQVIAFLSVVFAGGALWREVKSLNSDVRELKQSMATQTNMLVEMARQDQQLKDHDRRIGKLETPA